MKTEILKSIPQPLYRPEQVREYEAKAAQRAGTTLWHLMQRAGEAVFHCLQSHFPKGRRLQVWCGPGNNGGDGYVVACLAKQAGYHVDVFALSSASSQDAKKAAAQWQALGGKVSALLSDTPNKSKPPDVVVDAVFGTGLSRPVEGLLATRFTELAEQKVPVIAIDVPSGLNADCGQPQGCAIRAAHTVTMIAAKRGLFTGAARDYCGQLWLADLQVGQAFAELTEPSAQRLDPAQLRTWLPARAHASHKGHSGHLLVIGGQAGMAGAARLAGEAALRAGAGKVSVICEPGQESLVGVCAELMVLGLTATDPRVDKLVDQASVIAIGPGLGLSEWAQALWQKVRDHSKEHSKPVVVDADALNLLAGSTLEVEASVNPSWVLTPHPGEAARLLAWTTAEIQQQRWQAVRLLAEKFTAVTVLKGSGSLIYQCQSEQAPYAAVCPYGTPALAAAGMGDVLTGIIGGILAQSKTLGLSIWQSTCAAVTVHALAGEAAAQGRTRGIMASDLLEHIVVGMNPHEGK